MPRFNVRRPSDGMWACFSTVVDDYVCDWMTRPQYEDWRRDQYGRHCDPIERCNLMSYKDAEYKRKLRKEWEQTL